MAIDAETFEILIDTVRRFVRERLVPAEKTVEELDEVPADIVQEMKDLGLFGLSIPEEYGGIGLSMSQECQVAFEIGQTALAFRSVFGTNVGIGSQGILMDGTEEQKRLYLPRVATRRAHHVFCADRARRGLRFRGGQDAGASATATTMSSTARSASSPTRRAPGRSP